MRDKLAGMHEATPWRLVTYQRLEAAGAGRVPRGDLLYTCALFTKLQPGYIRNYTLVTIHIRSYTLVTMYIRSCTLETYQQLEAAGAGRVPRGDLLPPV